MKEFKFLHRSKRPILDSIFTEDELTCMREYCVDICVGDNDLLKYYHEIGLVEKRYFNGKLTGVAINFYKERTRCYINIDITTQGIFYVSTIRDMILHQFDTNIQYSEIYEEL